MRTFTLLDEQVDSLVVEELQDALERNLHLYRDEGGAYMEPDRQLLDSLLNVLDYFMPRSEFEMYKKEIALRRMVMETELLGLYDEQSDS